MSSTPLFDSIARRSAPQEPDARPSSRAAVSAITGVDAPVPASPLAAPVAPRASALVPAALVAAIDEIPRRVGTALPQEVAVSPEQLVLVEAVTDAIARAVVDAVVTEFDRIAREGVVRS